MMTRRMMFRAPGMLIGGLSMASLLYPRLVTILLLVILILGSTRLPKFFGEKMEKRFGENGGVMTGARMIFYLGILLLSVAYLVDATYNPFLYFRF